MCITDKQLELLEFVFDSVYVDLQYDKISLTSIAWSVSLWCVCSHVFVFGCRGTICGCGVCCDCDACTVFCVACVYADRV